MTEKNSNGLKKDAHNSFRLNKTLKASFNAKRLRNDLTISRTIEILISKYVSNEITISQADKLKY